jgi:hypothetical protein
MSSTNFYAVVGDVAASARLRLNADGVVPDLTGATVTVLLRNPDTGATETVTTVTVDADQVANRGVITIAWPTTAVDTPGIFAMRTRVVIGGQTLHYPSGKTGGQTNGWDNFIVETA